MAWVAIAVAGALGALARYGLSGWVHRFAGPGFPSGTLSVNLLGCFLLGLLTELARHGGWVSPELRVWVGIGFLGAFTTFSTFSYETVTLLRDGDWTRATLYTGLSFALGLTAVLIGIGESDPCDQEAHKGRPLYEALLLFFRDRDSRGRTWFAVWLGSGRAPDSIPIVCSGSRRTCPSSSRRRPASRRSFPNSMPSSVAAWSRWRKPESYCTDRVVVD